MTAPSSRSHALKCWKTRWTALNVRLLLSCPSVQTTSQFLASRQKAGGVPMHTQENVRPGFWLR